MLNVELLKAILIIAIASGVVMTALVQKIKESVNFKDSTHIVIISFVVNMIMGTLFALSFSDIMLINALWVGLFSFIGADIIYKALETKVFKTFGEIQYDKEVNEPIYDEYEV